MPFTFTQYEMSGLVLIEQKTFDDHRGYFKETYRQDIFAANGITDTFVQDNVSVSAMDVLRGLHFQRPPMAQAKLVTVYRGTILDVVVDLRGNSPTFKEWMALEISANDHHALFVPEGFAHGFLSLENDTIVHYKVSRPYSPEHDGGIRWNDPGIGVIWPVSAPRISEKDEALPFIDDLGGSVF